MITSATAAGGFEGNDLVEIKFPESESAVSFHLLQDAVVPRPAYLISTIPGESVDAEEPAVRLDGCERWETVHITV
jgi:hypothetical protein